MSSLVTVEKSYLESLIQRLSPSLRDAVPLDLDSVTIPRSEYENLLQISVHFKKLKDSLLTGGLSQETLDILIYGGETPTPQPYQNTHEDTDTIPDPIYPKKPEPPAAPVADKEIETGYRGYHRNHAHVERETFDDDEDAVFHGHDEKDEYDSSSKSGRSSAVSTGQRTVMIRGLPDRVTHHDITDAVRGGALLDIFLRAREHMASISFVEESAAQEFLHYVKQHGLYVAGKRVEALWSERQFYLPPYVRTKINNGATRNLMISNVNPNISEALIRRDLEHIHNLIVISVDYKNGNAYISTNSVHNALFARSCMMSRFSYKRMRISFYPDECADPFPKHHTIPKVDPPARVTKPAPVPNRFQLLSIEDSDDEDYNNDHDELTGRPSLGSTHWAESEITV